MKAATELSFMIYNLPKEEEGRVFKVRRFQMIIASKPEGAAHWAAPSVGKTSGWYCEGSMIAVVNRKKGPLISLLHDHDP